MPPDPQKKQLRPGAKQFLERAAAAPCCKPGYGGGALDAAQAVLNDVVREGFELRMLLQTTGEEDAYREVSGQLEELHGLYKGLQSLSEQIEERMREFRRTRAIADERRKLIVAELERQGWEVPGP